MHTNDTTEPGRTLPEVIAEAGAKVEEGLDSAPIHRARLQALFDQLTYIATYLSKFVAYLGKRS